MGEAIEYFMPPLKGPTDAEVAVAQKTIEAREAASEQQMRDTLLRCTTQTATGKGCGKLCRVGDLTYIQTHWYVEPHGCSGGDYWNQGEGKWRCVECGHINRLYASPEIEKMKRFFRDVEERHD